MSLQSLLAFTPSPTLSAVLLTGAALFLRTLHAAGFLDAGHAWTGPVEWRDRKIGFGAELSADVVAGFGLPLTWTAGVAWGRDGAGTVADTRSLYFRVGRSF